MADSQARRAPNASTDFVESKVKFVKNHTMSFLDEADDRDKLILFAKKRAKEISKLKQLRTTKINEVIEQRTKDIKIKRNITLRNKMESKVRPLISKTVSKEQLQEHFPEVDRALLDVVQPVLANPGSVVSQHVLHTWTDEDGNDVCYQGLVQKCKRKETVYSIS